MTRLASAVVLLCAALLAGGHAPAQTQGGGSIKAPAQAAPGAVTRPERSAAQGEPEVPALVLPAEETVLSSQMAGRIRHVSVGLGDEIKKGARLVEFDCSEQRAQLDAAQAEFRAARETHLARLRLQALGAAGELEVTVAAASADKARSQVALRQSQLAYCRVDAPFSGNVARLRVKASESVNAGQPLVDLVNPAALKAQMFVPAAWVTWIRVGTPVSLYIRETGQEFKGRVAKVNARVDGVSQQLEVEARIEKGGGRLLPGMVGMATFDRNGGRK